MKRHFIVQTEARFCKETGERPVHNKPFGYVIRIIPPIISYQHSEDVEGIGEVIFRQPKKLVQYATGWYKYRDSALSRLEAVKNSEYWNRENTPAPEVNLDLFG